ncbi:uncharacterized protein M6B38_205570 [Iris pallida]|uniref:Uncharacterized protein n=1 Tax=Iris pallida TaxID=29817 RepID=A0AAX6E805_IRIPA|nr:uncharacterized protein M6B38_205570 [Iris pallida]
MPGSPKPKKLEPPPVKGSDRMKADCRQLCRQLCRHGTSPSHGTRLFVGNSQSSGRQKNGGYTSATKKNGGFMLRSLTNQALWQLCGLCRQDSIVNRDNSLDFTIKPSCLPCHHNL